MRESREGLQERGECGLRNEQWERDKEGRERVERVRSEKWKGGAGGR